MFVYKRPFFRFFLFLLSSASAPCPFLLVPTDNV
jgi:hypothetical protein